MPKIRFIKLVCGHCGAEYRVRLDKVADRTPFECVSCGAQVETAAFTDVLEMIYQYSALVVKLEASLLIEGDTVSPLPKEPSKKLVTW